MHAHNTQTSLTIFTQTHYQLLMPFLKALRVETDQPRVTVINAPRSLPTLFAQHTIPLRMVLRLATMNWHNEVSGWSQDGDFLGQG